MFVIQDAQRSRLEQAKNNFLSHTAPWVIAGLKKAEKNLDKRIQDCGSTDSNYREKLDFWERERVLFHSFQNPDSALYSGKIQAMPYDQMEAYWSKTFLPSPEMKSILALLGENDILGTYPGPGYEDPFPEIPWTGEPILLMKSPNKLPDTIPGWKKALYKNLLDDLETIFPYEKLYSKPAVQKSGKITILEYNAYRMCRDLGIEICVYCNASYAYTITDKKDTEEICRPDLDHFMPKSHFPIFRLSFENLLPACNMCNSKLKGDKIMIPSRYLHAYQKIRPKMHFRFSDQNGEVLLLPDQHQDPAVLAKLEASLRFFKTRAVYRSFQTQVSDLWEKSQIYTPEYLEDVMQLRNNPDFQITDRFLNDLFGNVDEDDIMNTSLGAMRHELVEQILKKWKDVGME